MSIGVRSETNTSIPQYSPFFLIPRPQPDEVRSFLTTSNTWEKRYYPEVSHFISEKHAIELLSDPNRNAHIVRIAQLGEKYIPSLSKLEQEHPLSDETYAEVADQFMLWYLAAAPQVRLRNLHRIPHGRPSAWETVWLPRANSSKDYRAQQSVFSATLSPAELGDIANWFTESGVIIHSFAAADLYRRLHRTCAQYFADNDQPTLLASLNAVDRNKQAVSWLVHDSGRLISHHSLDHMFFSAVINGELGLPADCRKDEDLPTLVQFERADALHDPRDVEGILKEHGLERILGYISDAFTKFYHVHENGYRYSLQEDRRRETAELRGRRKTDENPIIGEEPKTVRGSLNSLSHRLRRPEDTISFLRSRAEHYLKAGEVENQRSYERQAIFLEAFFAYLGQFPGLLEAIYVDFAQTERYKHAMMRRYEEFGLKYTKPKMVDKPAQTQ